MLVLGLGENIEYVYMCLCIVISDHFVYEVEQKTVYTLKLLPGNIHNMYTLVVKTRLIC